MKRVIWIGKAIDISNAPKNNPARNTGSDIPIVEIMESLGLTTMISKYKNGVIVSQVRGA